MDAPDARECGFPGTVFSPRGAASGVERAAYVLDRATNGVVRATNGQWLSIGPTLRVVRGR
jgi:hypothetical protein